MGELRLGARGTALGAFVAALFVSGAALADMGPNCGCEVGSRTHLGRAALAATFGLVGLGVLFVERQRRAARTRR